MNGIESVSASIEFGAPPGGEKARSHRRKLRGMYSVAPSSAGGPGKMWSALFLAHDWVALDFCVSAQVLALDSIFRFSMPYTRPDCA